jgi:hypothetical protein
MAWSLRRIAKVIENQEKSKVGPRNLHPTRFLSKVQALIEGYTARMRGGDEGQVDDSSRLSARFTTQVQIRHCTPGLPKSDRHPCQTQIESPFKQPSFIYMYTLRSLSARMRNISDRLIAQLGVKV